MSNDADEKFLDFLESDVFKSGLKLATAAQPAVAPLSGLALGLTKTIAGRNRNVAVQDFHLGLDFTQIRFDGNIIRKARTPAGFLALWTPPTAWKTAKVE